MQTNQLPPLQPLPPLNGNTGPTNTTSNSFPNPVNPPLSTQSISNKTVVGTAPLPNAPVANPPLTQVVSPKSPVIVKKSGTNILLLIFIAVLFFTLGLAAAYFLYINRVDTATSTTDPTVTPAIMDEDVTQTPLTTEVTEQRYISDDLQISFMVPEGVTIEEKVMPYSTEGCLSGDEASYPTYNAIYAYKNGNEILFIGYDGSCDPRFIEDDPGVQLQFAKVVDGKDYRMYQNMAADNFGFMRMSVEFGANSELAPSKVSNNSAIMQAQTGAAFTEEDFDASVMLIASIEQL